MDKEASYKAERYRIRSNLLKYTRQAFAVLPSINRPHVLDIGCGSGIPTLELARMCDGEITGIDIDEKALEELSSEADKTGLADRVKALKCSVKDMEFPGESFNIIWAEGSIFTVGFKKRTSGLEAVAKTGRIHGRSRRGRKSSGEAETR